jgi:hypothetical protein
VEGLWDNRSVSWHTWHSPLLDISGMPAKGLLKPSGEESHVWECLEDFWVTPRMEPKPITYGLEAGRKNEWTHVSQSPTSLPQETAAFVPWSVRVRGWQHSRKRGGVRGGQQSSVPSPPPWESPQGFPKEQDQITSTLPALKDTGNPRPHVVNPVMPILGGTSGTWSQCCHASPLLSGFRYSQRLPSL